MENEKTTTRRLFMQGTAATALTAGPLATSAFAQGASDYPSRNIRSLCNFGPGSGADIVVRFYSDRLSKLAGQIVIVDNKPGAAGNIATQIAATAKPDGYTIMITPGNATLASAPHLFNEIAFDPIKSFEPVARLSRLPFVVIVKPDSPIKSIAELTAHLKAKGAKARYGTSTNTATVTAELYRQMAGLTIERINYNAVADTLRGLWADEFDFCAYDATWVAGMAKNNRVRPLAVTSAQRVAAFPDVPTMQESGFPNFELTPWWGVVVPAGTPKPIVEKLSGWFDQITRSQDAKDFLATYATDPWPGGPEDLRQLIASDIDAWGKYIALAKIEKM